MHVSGQGKAPSAYRTITEVAAELDVPQHVLRFWESRFPQIRPVKRGGGRRYYRPADIDLLRRIRKLLYEDGYTIRGAQKLLREEGREAGGAGAAPAADTGGDDLELLPERPPELLPDLPAVREGDGGKRPPRRAPRPSRPVGTGEADVPLLQGLGLDRQDAGVPSLAPAKRDALWDILIELRALRGTLRR